MNGNFAKVARLMGVMRVLNKLIENTIPVLGTDYLAEVAKALVNLEPAPRAIYCVFRVGTAPVPRAGRRVLRSSGVVLHPRGL